MLINISLNVLKQNKESLEQHLIIETSRSNDLVLMNTDSQVSTVGPSPINEDISPLSYTCHSSIPATLVYADPASSPVHNFASPGSVHCDDAESVAVELKASVSDLGRTRDNCEPNPSSPAFTITC